MPANLYTACFPALKIWKINKKCLLYTIKPKITKCQNRLV